MSFPRQVMIDKGDGTFISPEQARREALAERQRQLEIARMEARWLCENARANAEFWQHAAIFYDRFFSVLTPSYPFMVAAMEHFGKITPQMRQQLVARTPGDHRAEAAGMIAGMAVSFWLPTRAANGGNAFKLGTRAHFWSRTTNFSILASDAAKISKSYGLLNFYVKIPGVIEKVITVTNNNVFGICKFVVGQMANQVRGFVQRSQDSQQGGR